MEELKRGESARGHPLAHVAAARERVRLPRLSFSQHINPQVFFVVVVVVSQFVGVRELFSLFSLCLFLCLSLSISFCGFLYLSLSFFVYRSLSLFPSFSLSPVLILSLSLSFLISLLSSVLPFVLSL